MSGTNGMPPRILAVDFALTKSGLAAHAPDFTNFGPRAWTFDTERWVEPGTEKRPRKLVGRERRVAIIAEMVRAVALVRPHIILMEKLYVPVKVNEGFIDLCKMYGVVSYYLESQAPLIIVQASHIKIYATGNGDANKQAVMLAVERRYGHLVQISDDNEADAFTAAAMVAEQYGHPLSTRDGKPLPQNHLRALGMVKDWPVLNGAPGSSVGLAATTSRGPGRAGTVTT